MSKTLARFFGVAVLAMVGVSASAEDGSAFPDRVSSALEDGGLIWPPYIVGSAAAEVFIDSTVAAEDRDAEINEGFIEAKLATNFFFSENVYIETGLAFEPGKDIGPGQDRFFQDNALKIGALSLTYETDNFWVSAGKGAVNFGIARNVGPGIYGADVANDSYSIRGRVGASANVILDADELGAIALTGSVFTLDTSALATPFLTGRDGPSRDAGGAGNTSGLKNFAITVDGSGIEALPGFRYHVSVVRQSTDFIRGPGGFVLPATSVADETRFVLAGEATISNDDLSFTPLLEFAHLENARGLSGRREQYVTAGLDVGWDQWGVALATTAWKIDPRNAQDAENLQAQLSISYLLENGVSLQAGYRYLSEFDEDSHTLGVAFSYDFPFAL